MISSYWLKRRQPYWTRLEELLARLQTQGFHGLNRSELRELGLLYRQTATDLAAVRGDPLSRQQAGYLNQLLGRAHNNIYSGQKSSAGGVLRFYARDYGPAFRQLLPYTALATFIFVLGGFLGMALAFSNPDFMREFLGPQMVATIDRREMWTHSIMGVQPQTSSFIMTNNLTVTFLAFASGMAAGLGTVYVLFFNGLLLGVIGSACWLSGMSAKLWSFVAPHGVLELPAIFIAGGAGLRLAEALLFPGNLSRRDSLAAGGKQAARLVVGTIPMLVVAGIIEAFFSPSAAPLALKFGLAAALFTVLVAYLARGGRGGEAKDQQAPGTA
jgi:uncharacterized membrane protein SpoIIM required for sporulation